MIKNKSPRLGSTCSFILPSCKWLQCHQITARYRVNNSTVIYEKRTRIVKIYMKHHCDFQSLSLKFIYTIHIMLIYIIYMYIIYIYVCVCVWQPLDSQKKKHFRQMNFHRSSQMALSRFYNLRDLIQIFSTRFLRFERKY